MKSLNRSNNQDVTIENHAYLHAALFSPHPTEHVEPSYETSTDSFNGAE